MLKIHVGEGKGEMVLEAGGEQPSSKTSERNVGTLGSNEDPDRLCCEHERQRGRRTQKKSFTSGGSPLLGGKRKVSSRRAGSSFHSSFLLSPHPSPSPPARLRELLFSLLSSRAHVLTVPPYTEQPFPSLNLFNQPFKNGLFSRSLSSTSLPSFPSPSPSPLVRPRPSLPFFFLSHHLFSTLISPPLSSSMPPPPAATMPPRFPNPTNLPKSVRFTPKDHILSYSKSYPSGPQQQLVRLKYPYMAAQTLADNIAHNAGEEKTSAILNQLFQAMGNVGTGRNARPVTGVHIKISGTSHVEKVSEFGLERRGEGRGREGRS